MRVAEAVIDTRFLRRTHAIEYARGGRGPLQVSPSFDGTLLAVYRKRQVSGPWPRWHSTRGSGYGRAHNEVERFGEGWYGLWLPHLDDLIAECELVALADDDVPPPFQRYRERYGQPIEDGAPVPFPDNVLLD